MIENLWTVFSFLYIVSITKGMLFLKVRLSVKEEQNQKDNASVPPLRSRRLKGVFARLPLACSHRFPVNALLLCAVASRLNLTALLINSDLLQNKLLNSPSLFFSFLFALL